MGEGTVSLLVSLTDSAQVSLTPSNQEVVLTDAELHVFLFCVRFVSLFVLDEFKHRRSVCQKHLL